MGRARSDSVVHLDIYRAAHLAELQRVPMATDSTVEDHVTGDWTDRLSN